MIVIRENVDLSQYCKSLKPNTVFIDLIREKNKQFQSFNITNVKSNISEYVEIVISKEINSNKLLNFKLEFISKNNNKKINEVFIKNHILYRIAKNKPLKRGVYDKTFYKLITPELKSTILDIFEEMINNNKFINELDLSHLPNAVKIKLFAYDWKRLVEKDRLSCKTVGIDFTYDIFRKHLHECIIYRKKNTLGYKTAEKFINVFSKV